MFVLIKAAIGANLLSGCVSDYSVIDWKRGRLAVEKLKRYLSSCDPLFFGSASWSGHPSALLQTNITKPSLFFHQCTSLFESWGFCLHHSLQEQTILHRLRPPPPPPLLRKLGCLTSIQQETLLCVVHSHLLIPDVFTVCDFPPQSL